MKIEFGAHTKDDVSETLNFLLSEVTTEEANALKRVIYDDIKCLAIQNVQFLNSTKTSFPQELIKQRLELMYVKNTPNLVEDQVFHLNVIAPLDVPHYYVMSSAITELKNNVNQNILIVPLKPGEALNVKFELKKGSSRIHNTWAVVSVVEFDLVSDINDIDYEPNRTYKMAIETTNVLPPKKILSDACNIIINLLIANRINEKDLSRVSFTGKKEKGEFAKITVIIENNHHTICDIINNVLLRMGEKIVRKSASRVPDPTKPDSEVHLIAVDPIDTFNKAIDILIDRFKGLLSQIPF